MGWMTAIYQHAPMFVAEGDGAWFSDVDGHRYLDMNVADLSMNGGFGPPPVVGSVIERQPVPAADGGCRRHGVLA